MLQESYCTINRPVAWPAAFFWVEVWDSFGGCGLHPTRSTGTCEVWRARLRFMKDVKSVSEGAGLSAELHLRGGFPWAFISKGNFAAQLGLITHRMEFIPICSSREVYVYVCTMCVWERERDWGQHSCDMDNQGCWPLRVHQAMGASFPLLEG